LSAAGVRSLIVGIPDRTSPIPRKQASGRAKDLLDLERLPPEE
jgi:hypothetical protein